MCNYYYKKNRYEGHRSSIYHYSRIMVKYSHSMDDNGVVASPPLSGCHLLNELQESSGVLRQSLLTPPTHLVLGHLLLQVRLPHTSPERKGEREGGGDREGE